MRLQHCLELWGPKYHRRAGRWWLALASVTEGGILDFFNWHAQSATNLVSDKSLPALRVGVIPYPSF